MVDDPPRGLLFVLSGPSGVGKDSVINRLRQRGIPLHFTVTVTTRPMRPGEVHGINYFFATGEEFERMRREGELLECAVVHGNKYGTPRAQVREALRAGKDVLLKIDVQGAALVRQRVPGAILIFIAPPSVAELIERLEARGTESDGELRTRIRNADSEMADLPNYDYVVVNYRERLDETVDKVVAIITAEHCRVKPRVAEL
jgi:guanylate kinase